MKKLLTMAIMMIACLSISAHRTGVYFYFDNVDKHVYEDKNVKVFLYPSDDGRVCVIVNNKTKKVIYVDNGSSFFYNNEKAVSMYRARATTTGTMQTSGVAVNLGGIAYGLGARGAVTSALSAITVSRSSGDYSGITVSEKRIVPVAPLSSEVVYVEDYTVQDVLCRQRVVNDDRGFWDLKHHNRLVERGIEVKMNKKFERQYDENNSILVCKTILNYSFTEEMKSPTEVTASNFLKAIVVDSYAGVRKYESTNLKYCAKYKNAPDEYTLFNKEKDGDVSPLKVTLLPAGAVALGVIVVLMLI